MKNLYVGNMETSITVEELKTAFATYGPVEVVNIVTDKLIGVGCGFGFVEMTEDQRCTRSNSWPERFPHSGESDRRKRGSPKANGRSNAYFALDQEVIADKD